MKIEINEPCEQWLRDIMDKAFSKVEFQGLGHEAEIYVYDGELMDINIRYWESPLECNHELMFEKVRPFQLEYRIREHEGTYYIMYTLYEKMLDIEHREMDGKLDVRHKYIPCSTGVHITNSIGADLYVLYFPE